MKGTVERLLEMCEGAQVAQILVDWHLIHFSGIQRKSERIQRRDVYPKVLSKSMLCPNLQRANKHVQLFIGS